MFADPVQLRLYTDKHVSEAHIRGFFSYCGFQGLRVNHRQGTTEIFFTDKKAVERAFLKLFVTSLLQPSEEVSQSISFENGFKYDHRKTCIGPCDIAMNLEIFLPNQRPLKPRKMENVESALRYCLSKLNLRYPEIFIACNDIHSTDVPHFSVCIVLGFIGVKDKDRADGILQKYEGKSIKAKLNPKIPKTKWKYLIIRGQRLTTREDPSNCIDLFDVLEDINNIP